MRNRFPRTLREAASFFRSAGDCRDLVARLRWPDGAMCPSCGSSDIRTIPARALMRCALCRRQFSVKVGTIFEDSSVALYKWLAAIWAHAIAGERAGSHDLARSVDVTQKSAWLMLQRIRLASKAKGFRAPLLGRVDPTAILGRAKRPGVVPADRLASEKLVEFTRRLLNVSKTESDDARARYATEKRRR
jgi:transposase-like protein